jgi:hypothetical protein
MDFWNRLITGSKRKEIQFGAICETLILHGAQPLLGTMRNAKHKTASQNSPAEAENQLPRSLFIPTILCFFASNDHPDDQNVRPSKALQWDVMWETMTLMSPAH